MINKNESMPEPFLLEMGCHRCECKNNLNKEGLCFEPSPEMAEGYYWFYEKRGLFAISIFDLTLKENQFVEYQQPDFISVNHYDSISFEELMPYRKLDASSIRGHVSHGELFRARYSSEVPLKGMELMFMPGYYHDYLEEKYKGEFPDPQKAFLSVDGISDFPELLLLMRQIESFKGTGISAHMFYESKMAEALSLIFEKSKDAQTKKISLSAQDEEKLKTVREYIDKSFQKEIYTEDLSKIACMGQTKLRSSFKKKYGCTITEYIKSKRLSEGEYLLVKTDLTVAQIASRVGYSNSGRFASMFKSSTGLLPDEYRHLINIKK